MSNVQIDEQLFNELCCYFLQGDDDEYQRDIIAGALVDKLDKLLARQLFTQYKRAASPAERELARRQYLDHVGISRKFRTERETHLPY